MCGVGVGVDRLSGLPDELLVAILILVPLKSGIATSILSRRWRNVWTNLPVFNLCLATNLDEIHDKYNYKGGVGDGCVELFSLVDNILPRFTLPFISTFNFHLYWSVPDNRYRDYGLQHIGDLDEEIGCLLSSWFAWALHKQVRELCFKINTDWWYGCPLPNLFPSIIPLSVFQISSLITLELKPLLFTPNNDSMLYDYDTVFINLPNLKKLSVLLRCLDPRILEKLVSSTPFLEHLSFHILILTSDDQNYDHFTLNLSSPSLKHLDMHLKYSQVLVLNTPNLESINFIRPCQGLPQISFVHSPPALLASSISIASISEFDFPLTTGFFNVFSNSKTLTISDMKSLVTLPTPLIAPLTFARLTHLNLKSPRNCEEILLPGFALLQNCPVLEVLTMDVANYAARGSPYIWSTPDPTPQCLLTSVKRIEILICYFAYRLEDYLLLPLTYLLATAKALELLRIDSRPESYSSSKERSPQELHLINQLFQVPRTSLQCRVEFYGRCHSALGDGDIIHTE